MHILGNCWAIRIQKKERKTQQQHRGQKKILSVIFILTVHYLTLPIVIPYSVFGLSSKWWWWSVIPAA